MTIERPMFPPRAESQDSIIPFAAIDHRPDEAPFSESRKAEERPSAALVPFPRKRVPEPVQRHRRTLRKPYYERGGPSMHTFVFRSYDLIVESDEADLIRDVGLDIHKAEVKLRKIRERLQGIREQSAAQIQLLTAADTKLSAAIVAALNPQRSGSGFKGRNRNWFLMEQGKRAARSRAFLLRAIGLRVVAGFHSGRPSLFSLATTTLLSRPMKRPRILFWSRQNSKVRLGALSPPRIIAP